MMAHTKPPSLDAALDSLMLQNDPANPVVEVHEVAMTSTPEPKEAAAPPPVRRPKVERVATYEGILEELTAEPVYKRRKVALNSRVDDWIDAGIDKIIRDLAAKGVTVSKEDLVVKSLIRGLNLTPPEGWSLR
jgi:hypothetical protein